MVLADNPPSTIPAQYWGTVTYNGEPVATGQVEAVVSGVVCGRQAISNGIYGAPPPGKNLFVQGVGLNGKTIHFRIKTADGAVMAKETAIWQPEAQVELNLTYESSEDFAPVFQEITLSSDNHDVTLRFNRTLDNIDAATLKAGVQIMRDQTSQYVALGAADTVTIVADTIIIHLAEKINGSENRIKVSASVIKSNGDTAVQDVVETVAIEGCFIATAAYGSYLDSHVWKLRNFRDQVLLQHSWGQWFVREYYRYSPPVAELIASSDGLRLIVRLLLTPLVMAVTFPWAIPLLLILLVLWRTPRTLPDK